MILHRTVRCAWWDIRHAWRRKWLWALLVLGLGNLLARLMFGMTDVVPTTRMVLDVVRAEFLPVAAFLVLYGRAVAPVRGGWLLAAQMAAGALCIVGTLTAAGLLAVAYQLGCGHDDLQLTLYASGLYFNLGWPLLHLLALATCLRTVISAWSATVTAASIYLFARLVFEQPLLRFGAPVSPWSDMNGYGPFLAEHLAAGLFWTACSVLLIVAAHVFRRPRRVLRRRLTAHVISTAWAAIVAGAVTGLWLLLNMHPVVATEQAAIGSAPQPTYSRLDLAVDIFPDEHRLTSRGTAIVVNRHDVAIPRIHFMVPHPLSVEALSLTGQLEQRGARFLVYRLNRPLEPQETLRVEFDLSWMPEALPRARLGTGVLANGTFVHTADIVPIIGRHDAAAALVLHTRIGTALDQIAIAPGVLVRRWQEEGRSYFEYHAKQANAVLAPILSGRYAIAKDTWQHTPIEIYHHPAHAPNLDRLATAATAQIANRMDSADAPLRVVEVPDYRWFVDRSWLLGDSEPAATAHAIVDGVLCYSELDSF